MTNSSKPAKPSQVSTWGASEHLTVLPKEPAKPEPWPEGLGTTPDEIVRGVVAFYLADQRLKAVELVAAALDAAKRQGDQYDPDIPRYSQRQMDEAQTDALAAGYRQARAARGDETGLDDATFRANIVQREREDARRLALEEAAQVVNAMDLQCSEHTSPYDAAVRHAVKCRDAIRALAQAAPATPIQPGMTVAGWGLPHEANWDGYGALPISPEVERNAGELYAIFQSKPEPTTNGTVSFESERGTVEIGKTRISGYFGSNENRVFIDAHLWRGRVADQGEKL